MIVRSAVRPGSSGWNAAICVTLSGLVFAACGDARDPAPETGADAAPPAAVEAAPRATVRILEPADGAEVNGAQVRVVLAADNITIVRSGDTTPNSGHHHLLLNVPTPPEGEPIPSDQAGYVHLGQAQTEYTFENLTPGNYTLVAVIGDFAHRVIPQATDTTRFTVRPAN